MDRFVTVWNSFAGVAGFGADLKAGEEIRESRQSRSPELEDPIGRPESAGCCRPLIGRRRRGAAWRHPGTAQEQSGQGFK
jgi:hypothetical protein